jgi:SAM-dependent methyltransferase
MYVFPREHRLSFFKQCLGVDDLIGSKILDLGGNNGNLLRDLVQTGYDPADYTCLDVDRHALNQGLTDYPAASWIHYNAQNLVYNKQGIPFLGLPFVDQTFDYVFAYSVHSHTTYEQMLFDLSEIRRVLVPTGITITSIVDIHGIGWFLRKRLTDSGRTASLSEFKNLERYMYLVDNDIVLPDLSDVEHMDLMVSVYNTEWLITDLMQQGINAAVPIKEKILGFNQKGLMIKNENI